MGAKKIQISIDAGTTWFTFPGDKGEYHDDATAIKDTILGQDFESNQTGMINFTVVTNGLYKGFAGYVAKIKKSGTPTTFTALPTTNLGGKVYQITDATKQVWDRTTTISVFDNAVALASPSTNIISVDYLNGIVTLASGYTPTGAITFSGKYLPMTQVAKANSFTLTQTAATKKTSVYETAQANGGFETFDYGLRTVSLSLKGIYDVTNAFEALLIARTELIIEINPDGNSLSVCRGWFKPANSGQSGNVGEVEEQDLTFNLFVPDQQDVVLPFKWTFATGSTLNKGVQNAVLAWQNATLPLVNYLPDGATGTKGTAVVTECSLSGGLDVMNDFSIKFQGSGAPAAYP